MHMCLNMYEKTIQKPMVSKQSRTNQHTEKSWTEPLRVHFHLAVLHGQPVLPQKQRHERRSYVAHGWTPSARQEDDHP